MRATSVASLMNAGDDETAPAPGPSRVRSSPPGPRPPRTDEHASAAPRCRCPWRCRGALASSSIRPRRARVIVRVRHLVVLAALVVGIAILVRVDHLAVVVFVAVIRRAVLECAGDLAAAVMV